MMQKKIFFLFLIVLAFKTAVYAAPADTVAIAFWNVENLYDTVDDPNKNDEEFLPGGKKDWTPERYSAKLANLSKTILAMNNGRGPDVIGMAEVENRGVLEDLCANYLKKYKFGIAHIDSPDERGIDCALLYRSDKFTFVKAEGDTVKLADKYPTRLILHVELQTAGKQLLHIFVNHWPSRRNGQDKSEANRVAAAEVLKAHIAQLNKKNADNNIVIMGDFNDEPDNVSIVNTLGAALYTCDSVKVKSQLYNVSWERKSRGEGTLKFRDTWNLLDQIIISDFVLRKSSFRYVCGSYTIFNLPEMIEHGGRFEGSPLPTYGGDKYLGGFSDHFPVLAKFSIQK